MFVLIKQTCIKSKTFNVRKLLKTNFFVYFIQANQIQFFCLNFRF